MPGWCLRDPHLLLRRYWLSNMRTIASASRRPIRHLPIEFAESVLRTGDGIGDNSGVRGGASPGSSRLCRAGARNADSTLQRRGRRSPQCGLFAVDRPAGTRKPQQQLALPRFAAAQSVVSALRTGDDRGKQPKQPSKNNRWPSPTLPRRGPQCGLKAIEREAETRKSMRSPTLLYSAVGEPVESAMRTHDDWGTTRTTRQESPGRC